MAETGRMLAPEELPGRAGEGEAPGGRERGGLEFVLASAEETGPGGRWR